MILLSFKVFCKKHNISQLLKNDSSIYKLLKQITEIIISDEFAILLHRYQISKYRVYKIGIQEQELEEISIRDLLDFQDRFFRPELYEKEEKLRINMLPFYDYSPSIRDVKSVGKGVEFLNKHMSSSIFQNPEKWKG